MKIKILLPLLLLTLMATSCTTVKVVTDYDKNVDFTTYKTFAFYKPGIDQAKISDLDKRRILRAIDAELTAKGMQKTEMADILVSIFTKENERVDIYNNNFGYGWGWNPWWYGGYYGHSVSTSSEGTLFIDFIDAKTNHLVWQGIGNAQLITSGDVEKKEARINEIVKEILAKYPPNKDKK